MRGSEGKRGTSGSPAEECFSLPRVECVTTPWYGGAFDWVMASNDARCILRPSRDSGGLIDPCAEKKENSVSTVYPCAARGHGTHFKHTTSTLRAVVRTLGLRPPANATPPSRLRVIVRRRRGTKQRVFDAYFVSPTSPSSGIAPTDILRFGIWNWARVACHADDERAEGEEGKGVDDKEVRDKVKWGT